MMPYGRTYIFAIEDLHWIDPSSLQLIAQMIASEQDDPILIVATARPEFESPWSDDTPVFPVELNRLEPNEVKQMMLDRSAWETIPAETARLLIRRTDGVPLFIEEFASMIRSGDFDSREVPETLQELLLARLDRVHCNLEVVQIGAAIGREFRFDLVAAVSGIPDTELQQELDCFWVHSDSPVEKITE